MRTGLMKGAAIIMCAGLMAANLVVAPGAAQAAGKVAAIVTFIKGKVEVKRAGAEKWVKLKVNNMLSEGDLVRTRKRSRAGLAFTGGAELRLEGNTHFKVGEAVRREQEVGLKMGQIWTKMLHKMARIRVRTPTAVAAVRGTEADIEMRGIMTVKVYEGRVDLMNPHGRRSLKAGQMSQVASADSAPSAPRKMEPEQYGTWQEAVRVKNMDQFIKMLKIESKKPGEKTMEFDIRKGDKTKKVKVKLKKK